MSSGYNMTLITRISLTPGGGDNDQLSIRGPNHWFGSSSGFKTQLSQRLGKVVDPLAGDSLW